MIFWKRPTSQTWHETQSRKTSWLWWNHISEYSLHNVNAMVEQFDLVKHIIKRHLNGKNIGKQGYDLRRKSQSRKICNISTIYWIPWKWLNSDLNSKLTQIRYYQRNRVFSHVSYRLWLQEDINYQQSYMSIGQVWDSTRWNLADKILTSVSSSHWLLQVTCCCQIVWKFYCCYTTQREVSRAENSFQVL